MSDDMKVWKKNSKCKTLSLSEADRLFWLGKGGSPNRAKSFCADCPVIKQCRNFAIVHEEDGIWGGLTKKERETLVAEYPRLREKLVERARQEGWLVEHQTVPIALVEFYQVTIEYQSNEDTLFDHYLSTIMADSA